MSERAPLDRLRRACLLALPAAWAGGLRAQGMPVPPARMADLPLQGRDGRALRWRSDVLRERTVIVNFVYTSCSSLCPPASAAMAALQQRLAQAPLPGTALVSISVDPLTDTPARLDAFARAFDPGPDWCWLTGEPRPVFELLAALGAGTGGDPQSHQPLWLVGHVARGPWRRLVGLPTPAQLYEAARAFA